VSAGLLRFGRLVAVAAGYEMRKATAFRVGFLLREVLVGLPRPVVMSLVYLAIYRSNGRQDLAGFSFEQMVGYLILAALLMKLVPHEWLFDLADQIFEGYVTKFLVMPFPYFALVLGRWLQYLAVQVAMVVSFWIAGALLLPAWWPVPAQGFALLQAAVLVLLGGYCFVLTYFCLNALAFWLDVVWTLLIMMRFITGFVGGLVVPVSIMPEPLQRVFGFAFPYWTISAPAELLLGRLHSDDFLRGLLVLGVTALLLQGLAFVVWRRGLARYQGAGM
jgi:ABC-2 type transport system permease protein